MTSQRLPFVLRFDFRNPDFAGTSMADRYQAALDMVEWADSNGCIAVTVSEHHFSPDGYLPCPLPMLAAMATRTERVQLSVAALIAPFYEPIRLAEDLAVLDHLSRGRVSLIVGAGYVRSEFEGLGIPVGRRVGRLTEAVRVLKDAFKGAPFAHDGRTVQVTPAPYTPGGPTLVLGGSSEAAARRAARIADGFLPTTPDVWEFYRDETAKLGKPDPGPCPMGNELTVALADDPEQAWSELGPYFLHETNAYGAWLRDNDGVGPYRVMASIEELREAGLYAIFTPEEFVQRLEAMPFPYAVLHPMCGGIPPELAWRSLRLFESEVIPAF
jgi:alkanesulfonate monooxygenase SsuD/methylene tetrahydromethanopterin reductase-like flavin-dependent oxidoreductase (luciferase family)